MRKTVGFLYLLLCAAAAQAQFVEAPIPLLDKVKSIEASPVDIGKPESAIDGDESSVMRTAGVNPAFIRVEFREPITCDMMRFVFSASPHQFTVAIADNIADLKSRKGSYKILIKDKKTTEHGRAEVPLAEKTTIRAMEMDVRRLTGNNFVHIYELQLCIPQQVQRIRIQRVLDRRDPSKVAEINGPLRVLEDTDVWFKAVLTVGGKDQDVSDKVSWTGSGTNIQPVAGQKGMFWLRRPGRYELNANMGNLAGLAQIEATPRVVVNRSADVEVQYIERQPRLPYDGPNGGLPLTGSQVTWRGHLWNWGEQPATVKVQWKLDGKPVAVWQTTLKPMHEALADYPWTWDPARHDLTLTITPISPAAELIKRDDTLTVQTDALAVGFWVERSLWDYMHEHQHELPTADANSFAGWSQRMMRQWNQMFTDTKYRVFPAGITERVRLDHIVIVPDFALPIAGGLPSNNPDNRDKTVDILWGMEGSDVASGKEAGPNGWWSVEKAITALKNGNVAAKKQDPPFWCGLGYIHEMNHARYLVDSYGFDVHTDAGQDPAKWNIKVTDEKGPILGRYIPMKTGMVWSQKHVGIMGGDYWKFSAFEAMCWNRVRGRRARGGNYNAPETIGEFLQDIPKRVVLQFFDPSGKPLDGAEVTVYRAHGTGDGWYTKVYEDAPALKVMCDGSGRAVFDRTLWSEDGHIKHDFGVSQAVALLCVKYRGQRYYLFECVADANIAFNLGMKDEVVLKRQIRLRTGEPSPSEWNLGETWEVPGTGFEERR